MVELHVQFRLNSAYPDEGQAIDILERLLAEHQGDKRYVFTMALLNLDDVDLPGKDNRIARDELQQAIRQLQQIAGQLQSLGSVSPSHPRMSDDLDGVMHNLTKTIKRYRLDENEEA